MRLEPIAVATWAILSLSAVASAQEPIPIATVGAMKEATAFVRTGVEADGDGPAFSGTAFLIRAEGTTGYLVTNNHVVTPKKGDNPFTGRPTTRVFFRSGTKRESVATAEVVATDARRDLAILKVEKVADLPMPVDLGAEAEPFETMTVYIFGFPFGAQLAAGAGNPPVNVGRGQVSSLRRDKAERLTSVLLDGALNPGNSGGPVVDAKGRLVGVARATIRGANIGFAIALPEVLAMLSGSVQPPSAALRAQKAGPPDLEVDAALLDPLGRVRSARLLVSTTEPKFSKTAKPGPDADADVIKDDDEGPEAARDDDSGVVFGPIEGAKSIPMTLKGPKATASVPIPNPGADTSIWIQSAVVDASGKAVHSRPVRHLIGASDPASKGKTTDWGDVVDPDGDCKIKLDKGDLVGEVPGSLHDLNVDIGVNNAPRIVRPIEGDFVASVKVSGSFEPGAERTGPKSVPCNLGGLVLWLDGANYVRLERGAMYRNRRVVGFLNFELRERGSKTDGHNKGGLDPAPDRWLRLERRGKLLVGSMSEDGKSWEELGSMEVDWPARLLVGVDLINSSADPMKARFHAYSLARPSAKTDARR